LATNWNALYSFVMPDKQRRMILYHNKLEFRSHTKPNLT
jgi:hypothetical protein